jgi:hypothetical protein
MEDNKIIFDQLMAIIRYAMAEEQDCVHLKESDLYERIKERITPISHVTELFEKLEIEPSISVLLGSRKITMIPDLLVTTNNGEKIVIEVKQSQNLSNEMVNLACMRLYNILENINAGELNIIGGVVIVFSSDKIVMRKIVVNEEIKFVRIYEQILGPDKAKMAIFVANSNTPNPTLLLERAVSKYVGTKSFNQFRDVHSDNPWVRIVITGINNLDYDAFTTQRL